MNAIWNIISTPEWWYLTIGGTYIFFVFAAASEENAREEANKFPWL